MTFTAKRNTPYTEKKINLPRCRDRVCSETTDTPRKWNREKHDENDHKRDILATKTNYQCRIFIILVILGTERLCTFSRLHYKQLNALGPSRT